MREYYRVLSIVGLVGVVVLAWVHRAAAPDAIDPLWQRVVAGGACLALLVATWRLSLPSVVKVAYAVYYILTIWVLQLLVLNQFAEDYAFAVLVVTAGIAGTYRDRRQLFHYQVVTLAGIGVGSLFVAEHGVSLPVYFAYSVVLAVLVYVAVVARLNLDEQRADSEQRYEAAAERLEYEATHNRVTALPNRVLLLDRIERLLTAAKRRAQSQFAVLVIDLNRFTRVNDSLGHAAGDTLLGEIAGRFRSALRDEDTLAHVGGNAFVVVVPAVPDEEDVLRVAERLNSALVPPLHVAGEVVHIGASIGITLGPNGYATPGEMLRDADLAMHRSKREWQSRPQLFDEQMHRHAMQQLRLEAELREAIEQQQLELHYQPIINMATGRVEGLEALVRWRHPQHGLLLPALFLPLAEETGLVVEIGRWALGEACMAQGRWAAARGVPSGAAAAGIHLPTVHVNISGAHFTAGTVVEDVARAMAASGHAPRLGVEVTESVLLTDPGAAAEVLAELKRQGVAVAIDDFGTGYSSLRYLHSLPADALKIDRSFVARSPDRSGMDLIRSIILLAEQLSLSSVAEGVETEDQAALLRQAGATHAQGFLYSAALPEDETALTFAGE